MITVAVVTTPATVAVGLSPGKEGDHCKVGDEDEAKNNQRQGEELECTRKVWVKIIFKCLPCNAGHNAFTSTQVVLGRNSRSSSISRYH